MNYDRSERFNGPVYDVLTRSGWYPGRKVPELVANWVKRLDRPARFSIFPTAETFLLEFGGLRIDQDGPGISCARTPFHLNPLLALGEYEYFEDYARQVESTFYPLGEMDGGDSFLAIDCSGRVFGIKNILSIIGLNIEDALANLILGERGHCSG